MNKQKLKIVSIIMFLIILILGFFFYYQLILKNQKETKQNQISNYTELLENSETKAIETFSDITSTGEILELKNNINSGNFEKIQETVEKIVSKISDNSKLDEVKKTKKVALKYVELGAILNEGNYYYKEKEVQKKVQVILNEIKEIDNDLFDNFYGNYYLGYSNEIIKNYDEAMKYYNLALSYSKEENKYTSSSILNQIGHLYDLRGDMNKAYEYYFKAYNLNKQNFTASTNIARYLTRIGEYKKAKTFFEYSLNTRSITLKSEIYFSLSSIELELNGLKPDIDKSIEYAKLSIQSFQDYPMGYLALARGYYMLNNSKYDKLIEENLGKSIKLNPNGFESYKYYALYYLDKNNINNSLLYLNKSNKAIDKDMILMENQKISLKYSIDILEIFSKVTIYDLNSIYTLYKDERIKYYIKLQLKRNNLGIYKNIKNEKNMEKIINYFN